MTTSNTPNTPDGVSFAELQNYLKTAPKGEPKPILYGGKTKDQMLTLVEKKAADLLEECPDPMAHKAIVIAILTDLINWHMNASESNAMDGQLNNAAGWSIDAGGLMAALGIIRQVDVGEEKGSDFFMTENPFQDKK